MNKAQCLDIIANADRPIAGQHFGYSTANYTKFITDLYTATGKYPGIIGTEYGHGQTAGQLQTINDLLITHWNAGGLVVVTPSPNNPWTGGSYKDQTDADLTDLMDPMSAAYAVWMTELALYGDALQYLKDAGVVVLWRPFCEMQHLAAFWWDSGVWIDPDDPSEFFAVWQHQYNYLVNTRGLDNLIWVYACSDNGLWLDLRDDYPGDNYVDIVGIDLYSDSFTLNGLNEGYNQLLTLGKPFAFTEGGTYLAVDGSFDNRNYDTSIATNYPAAKYFMVWTSWTNHKCAIVDNAYASELMNSATVITRDELAAPAEPATVSVFKNDPGVVVYLSLDEPSAVTRMDYSPNHNNLGDATTIANDTSDKKEGFASADFIRANNEKLTIADASQAGLDLAPPFSIVFWVQYDVNDNTEGTFGKAATSDYAYCCYRLSGSPYKIRLRLSSNGTAWSSFDSDNGVSSANWHHIAFVADGTDVRIYIDGVLDTASPIVWTAALHNSDADFKLGDRFDGNYMDGHLDAFCILNRALSEDEITSIYTTGFQDPIPFMQNGKLENVLLRL